MFSAREGGEEGFEVLQQEAVAGGAGSRVAAGWETRGGELATACDGEEERRRAGRRVRVGGRAACTAHRQGREHELELQEGFSRANLTCCEPGVSGGRAGGAGDRRHPLLQLRKGTAAGAA